ncbi:MAG: SAF domain-containing protein, partial [Sciscionella sp.]
MAQPLGPRGLPTRQRRKGQIALAALFVAGCALAGAVLFGNAGHKVSVLEIGAQPVVQGHVITRADLRSAAVAGVGQAIPVSQAARVVGKTAATDLVPGQLLTPRMVTATPVPGAGQSLVGLSLAPSRVPSAGLAPGDVVSVVAVPAQANGGAAAGEQLDSPRLLTSGARVYDIAGSATAGGQRLVTLVVDAGDASRLAAYSTANQVAVVETSPADQPAGKGG